MLDRFLYCILKKLVAFCFNLLNIILLGNLPPLGSACIVVEEQGRYLVVRHSDGQFVLPGGFMRWSECPAQTAQRECLEETGLQVRIGEMIGSYTTTSSRLDQMSSLTLIYHAEVVGGNLRGSIEGKPSWKDKVELYGKMACKQDHILDNLHQSSNPIQFEHH